ncbi:protein kinase, putative [Trypanosoma cruzi marinkellei]|uniref:Protein kinase, putative n=1 Tax=Trypanosoma cruzi marinkellei TaxID=85056 RepID=K2NGF6_TRYCR|nr:protein kinase, putative [Trypanosoma cruzi marinkellei]
MDSANSHVENNSVVGPPVSEPMVLEARTFCVVCGHFGSDFVLRKSGLKCSGCVGKTANKSWARLQQRQANELLSQATTRARIGSISSGVSGLGEHFNWTNFSVVESEEADSVPHEHIRNNGSSFDVPISPLPHVPHGRPLTPHMEGEKVTSSSSRQPHIMDYISNTACYQAAAAGISVKDAMCLVSNVTDSSTQGTNEDSYVSVTNNSLIASAAVSAPRRKAPAVPPRAKLTKPGLPSTEDVAEGGVMEAQVTKGDGEQKETTLHVRKLDPTAAHISPPQPPPPTPPIKTCGGPSSRKKRVKARETVVVDASYAVESSSGEVNGAESDEGFANTEGPLTLPPLLQSDSCYVPPKTPRADDFMILADASSDTMANDETYELQRSAAPVHTGSNDGKLKVPTSSQSFPNTSSMARTEVVKTKATQISAAQPASTFPPTSVQSSTDGTRSLAMHNSVSSRNGGDVPRGFPARKGLSATSTPGSSRTKVPRVQVQKQEQGLQMRQPSTSHVDPMSRSFGRCEITTCDSLRSSSLSSSSPSSSSLSSLERGLSRADASSQEKELPAEVTSQCQPSLDNASGLASSYGNIDRLYIKVEEPHYASPDETLLGPATQCFSASFSTNTMNQTTVPVPSAPGSKFTVTRHFLSSNQPQENANSLLASQRSLDQNAGLTTEGGEDTSLRTPGRRRSSASADRVEARKITFILCLYDRDSREELHSVRCRYFSDLVPLFQELKSLMNTLPQISVIRIPSVRYVPESYVAERREECQTFMDAVVQNHFLIRHPKMVKLLRLESYLNQNASLAGTMNMSSTACEEGGLHNTTKIGRRDSVTLFTQLDKDSLDQPRGMSSRNFLGRQMSTSSCLSTTSSVARRGTIDSIIKEDLEKVQLGNLIGRGTFGAVYLGLLPGHSTVVAVKIVKVNENVDEDFLHSMRKELDVLRAARHHNILRFLGSTYLERERELRVFTEYVECGNISTMVKKFGSLPLVVIQKYMIQILRGLQYLHNMAIVHRDIKGENILITKKGRCKLADFGCSGTLHEVEGREEMQGSPLWIAPEIINGAPPATAGDIWALGCVGIEMLQRPIWNIAGDLNPYIFLYRIGKLNGPPHGLPTEEEVERFGGREETREEYTCFGLYRDFLSCCLRMKPEERWSADELLKHPFLQKSFSKHLRWTPPKVDEEVAARTTA